MTKASTYPGPAEAARKIPQLTKRIVDQFNPIKIILFGSHARGDPGIYSDIDLLVVLDRAEDTREASIEIRRALRGSGVAIDVIATTPAEVEEFGDMAGGILRPALREGKVLYARDAK